jgi:hypothetical protein
VLWLAQVTFLVRSRSWSAKVYVQAINLEENLSSIEKRPGNSYDKDSLSTCFLEGQLSIFQII